MISNLSAIVLVCVLLICAMFIIWSLIKRPQNQLMHRLYLSMVIVYAVWVVAILSMKFVKPYEIDKLFALDCVTSVGYIVPVIYLLIAISFVKGYTRMPRWGWLLFVVPLVSVIVVSTNPLHHLQYVQFSVVRSEIIFGPYLMVTGSYSYLCFVATIIIMVNFAVKNKSRLYMQQSLMLSLGGLIPMIVSITATVSAIELPITATPLSFIPIVLCNGIAIYQLNILDITPIARQQILDWTTDCHLILSDKGLVISYNSAFASVFASRYGITENRYLRDCLQEEDVSKKTAVYNLITAVDACAESNSTISYEQAATVIVARQVQKNYYLADVSSLRMKDRLVGFVVIFKDITQLKKSLQQLRDSERRMIEQERFAFLGQMMSGLAHNLKTPIMSVAGCISAADNLIAECDESLGDPSVSEDDYREIFGEIRTWHSKVLESTSYMSDIINTVKGQAGSVKTAEGVTFTLDELIKRTTLLMRHELMTGGCSLVSEFEPRQDMTLDGDVNVLIQVLSNLVSNAIYAQKEVGGGTITIGIRQDENDVKIYVKDTGSGIPPDLKGRLFKEMVTSKGVKGTGLGLYISNVVVRANFGGTMWAEDNPEGGSVFGITIPTNTCTTGDSGD